MKKMKKIMALVIAVTMMLAMGMTAMAQTEPYSGSDGATDSKITVTNAAKGETYKVVKLFGATVGGNGEIAYTGTIPEALNEYFVMDSKTKAITATEAAKAGAGLSEAATTALKTWAESHTAVAEAVADGTALEFTGLPYGYYVVLTTQGAGAVSVTSTNPTAEVTDKNTTEPDIEKKVKNAAGEWVEVTDANIGEVKDFKLDINTTNWHEKDGTSKQVKEYVIGEDFATNKFELVSIDKIQVIEDEKATDITIADGQVFPVTVPWTNADGSSKYENGATIHIEYKAKLKDDALVDVGNENEDLRGNVNTADLNWKYTDGAGGDQPHFGEGEDKITDTASVDTYAIALKKFDKEGNALAGAKFQFPFYVKATPNADGNYVYAGTEAGEGLTNVIETPAADGQITVVGVKAGTYEVTETEAPDGYNLLDAPISIEATKISTTTTTTTTTKTWKIDADGNVTDLQEGETAETTTTYTNNTVAATTYGVINLAGSVLPGTGGMGTTIFYLLGGILVIGAAIMLIARRRVESEK